MHQIIDLRK